MSRIASCVRLLVILLGSLWLGYSLGYTAAMNEVGAAQGEARILAQVVRDQDGAFYIHGDPDVVARTVRYWWEHEQHEQTAAP